MSVVCIDKDDQGLDRKNEEEEGNTRDSTVLKTSHISSLGGGARPPRGLFMFSIFSAFFEPTLHRRHTYKTISSVRKTTNLSEFRRMK